MAGALNGLTASPIASANDNASEDPLVATLAAAIQAVNSQHWKKAQALIEDAFYAVTSK